MEPYAYTLLGMMAGSLATIACVAFLAQRSIKKAKEELEPLEKKDKLINDLLGQNNKLQQDQKSLMANLKYYDETTPAHIVQQCRTHNTNIYTTWSTLEDRRIALLEQVMILKEDVKITVEDVRTKALAVVPLQAYLSDIKGTLARYRLEDEVYREAQAVSTYPLNKTYLA